MAARAASPQGADARERVGAGPGLATEEVPGDRIPSAAPGAPDAAEPGRFRLERMQGCLQLRALHRPAYAALAADWLAADLRRRIGGGRRQLLARAVGLHRNPCARVIDATAGLGRDGFTLAALGAEVIMLERHPTVSALLRDAQLRALQAADPALREAAARCTITEADAAAWLRSAPARADAIHLDPMYPEDGKSALPQKAMQLLRELTGGDADADRLLEAALDGAAPRVAVKRPLKAPWLGGRAPSAALRGTQSRYDLYLPPRPCSD